MLLNHKRMRNHGCLQTTQRSNICLKLSITSLPKSSIKWIQLLLRFQLQLRLKPAARSPTLSMMLKEKLLGLGADRRQRNWKAWLSMAVVMVWQQHKSSLLFIQAFPNMDWTTYERNTKKKWRLGPCTVLRKRWFVWVDCRRLLF